jgi:hypothetical protein
VPFLRAIAASFFAFAAARRSSRVRVGLLASSSSDDSSSESSSSSSDELASGFFSLISFPSASRGRRLREKCLPPITMSDNVTSYLEYEDDLPPRVNFLNLPPRPRPAAPGGPPGAIVCVGDRMNGLRDWFLKVVVL